MKSKISFEELPQIVGEIHDMLSLVIEQLNQMEAKAEQHNELMTRKQTAEYFKCDISTIHLWTKKGKLTKHCIGNRVYYKRSEITQNMTKL
jgi:hypothetical protein